MKSDLDTLTLLGLAIFQAQRLEFALYGLAAHFSHLPEAQKDQRFANLSAKDFLSADPEKRKRRKATFGQITKTFGDRFLLPSAEIEDLVERRNIIAHEFWREVETDKGTGTISDPNLYLRTFSEDCDKWLNAIRGFLSELMEAAAGNEGRSEELVLSDDETLYRQASEIWSIGT